MHRAFVTQRDRTSYAIPESPKPVEIRKKETEAQARERTLKTFERDRREALTRLTKQVSKERAEHMAAHAVYEAQRPQLVGDDETQAINARYGVPDTYASTVPDRFRKGAVPLMNVDELSEGPNLPHRDDKDISERARDISAKAGYYHAAVEAYSSDAYMSKRSPIEQKGNARHTYHRDNGEVYVLPHGAGSKYRRTVDKKTGVVTDPHQQDGWGRALTASNKHLGYWRNPTEREALRNLSSGPAPEPVMVQWRLTLPRDMLIMLATVCDIQAQRGKLAGDNRSDMLREIAATVPPGEDVELEWFTPKEVLAITQGLPKRYRKGEFGQFLKDTATRAKLMK